MREEWAALRRTPVRLRLYLVVLLVASALPAVLPVPALSSRELATALCLVSVSVLNVEIGRLLIRGRSEEQQAHKALSAWSFAAALLLSSWWLFLVVPLTYVHARMRGLRVTLWKWVGSGFTVLLAGYAAALTRWAVLGDSHNLMYGDGGLGLIAMLLGVVAFHGTLSLLLCGFAYLNAAEDEVWLRATLKSSSFYLTEVGVLLMGGLVAAVWTGGAWFSLLFVPIYWLAQRAALTEPLRERAELAAELEVKNGELEHSNQFKVDLIGMLGHELGNPLTSVQGYAEIGSDAMADDDLDTARSAYDVVRDNAEKMRTVLADILSLVTSESLVATPERCEVGPRLRAALGALPPGRRPEVDCAPGTTALVQPGHLDQILANLMSNAEKYGGGATQLTVRHHGDFLEVAVVDGGPGVPEAFRGSLFERYSRHDGTSTVVRGAGLGLFICRELARANGGDLVHRDVVPQGSEFVVLMPAA